MSNTNQNKKKLTLFDILLVIIFLPFYLLFSKKTRKVTWAIVLVALAVIFVPKLMSNPFSGGEQKGKVDISLLMYQFDEGEDQKVMDKLVGYFENESFADAEKLMQANEWFVITDADQATNILDRVENSKKSDRDWIPVMHRIKCKESRIVERLDDIYYRLGYSSFYRHMNLESAAKTWGMSSEGSAGKIAMDGFSKIMEGDLIGGAEILNQYSRKEEEIREDYERCYSYVLEKSEYTTLEEHLAYMTAYALISGMTPADALENFQTLSFDYRPNDFLHNRTQMNYTTVYDEIVLSDALRAQLPSVLKKAKGDKVLVVDRVLICGTDEIKIAINTFMMESLPEQYRARSFEEVGYVLVMDYGYERDGIWYAGTAMGTLYEVAGGTSLCTSKEIVGTYEMSYFGPQTNVIFGSYPGVAGIVNEVLCNVG